MDRLQDFSDGVLSLGRKALFPMMLGAAACAPNEVTDPSGGGSGYEGTDEEDSEVTDFTSLTSEECRAFVEVANSNPESDLQIAAVPHRLDSAWEVDGNGDPILTYDEQFTVDDEVDPNSARKLYACVTWNIENAETYAASSDALRDGPYLHVSAETTSGITDQVTAMTVQVIVDDYGDRNDLRFAQFGAEDTLIHPVDQDSDENPISE